MFLGESEKPNMKGLFISHVGLERAAITAGEGLRFAIAFSGA